MATFSERHGYVQPSSLIIRERITQGIQNAICNCFEQLNSDLQNASYHPGYQLHTQAEESVWMYFLNEKKSDFWVNNYRHRVVIISLLEEVKTPWYTKLDLLEFVINYLHNSSFSAVLFNFTRNLNAEFKRLNFAYRIVDFKIIEVSSEEEIAMIETAIITQKNNIKQHLQKAIELYAKRPEGDFQNSIKESISAVEAFCREVTGEMTLGKALSKLESRGLELHPMLKIGFEKLYVYTNDHQTGIRHALMDTTEAYTPSSDEALLMLVLCSSFLNYLEKKRV